MINQNDIDEEIDEELKGEDDYIGESDDQEFLKNANELDLPDTESEREDNEADLKGDETDSELEDYYKELGIEEEEDLSKSKKQKKKM